MDVFAIVNLRRRAASVRHWREDMQVIVALKGDAGEVTERMHLGFFVNNSAIRSLASDPAIFLCRLYILFFRANATRKTGGEACNGY